jgi:hypothetical protein
MTDNVVNIGDVRRKARKPRPRKYVWLNAVKMDPRVRNYPHISRRLFIEYCDVLMLFDSFCREGVWAGRLNWSKRLDVSIRQITRVANALEGMGHIKIQRRGRSTNLIVPFLNGQRLFPMGPQGHPNLPKLDSNIPELNPPEPPTAHVDPVERNTIDRTGNAALPTSEPSTSGETANGLPIEGEILGRADISFPRFWNHSRLRSHPKDSPGPARKRWEALSEADRSEIAARLERDGEIDLGLMWTCVWLDHRCWREEPLRRSGTAGILDRLGRLDLRPLSPSPPALTRPPDGNFAVVEHTRAFEEWCQYLRQRRIIVPLVSSIVDENGKKVQGFYCRSPRPPDEEPEPR